MVVATVVCTVHSLVSRMAAALPESDGFPNKRHIHIHLKFLFFNSCYHFYIQIIFSQILPKDSKIDKRFLKICCGGFFFFKLKYAFSLSHKITVGFVVETFS